MNRERTPIESVKSSNWNEGVHLVKSTSRRHKSTLYERLFSFIIINGLLWSYEERAHYRMNSGNRLGNLFQQVNLMTKEFPMVDFEIRKIVLIWRRRREYYIIHPKGNMSRFITTKCKGTCIHCSCIQGFICESMKPTWDVFLIFRRN